ncbi:hypothetical protein ACUIJQ_12855 [Levilactobacillus hammesii]|uniref:Uncharacterized protein n=1 Tax=Levilactobacillus hammesii DSM 16381 TaxID=1423753 RepID=A0A0R1UYA5_9LACO|nr:hypothetical protein [Levilactobacillus hammesii]KRL98301.1 hypothetical protein FD28_GL000100 [Levilactobacillus hammesii DSM 16381]
MKKILPALGGLLIIGGVLLYQQFRHVSGIAMLETAVLGIAAFLGILHLISHWCNR